MKNIIMTVAMMFGFSGGAYAGSAIDQLKADTSSKQVTPVPVAQKPAAVQNTAKPVLEENIALAFVPVKPKAKSISIKIDAAAPNDYLSYRVSFWSKNDKLLGTTIRQLTGESKSEIIPAAYDLKDIGWITMDILDTHHSKLAPATLKAQVLLDLEPAGKALSIPPASYGTEAYLLRFRISPDTGLRIS